MLLDILFPRHCLGCGRLGIYICTACRRKLVYLERQRCLYCHRDSYLGFTHAACLRTNGVDGVLSIVKYNNHFKTLLKQLKYRLVYDAFSDLFLSFNPERLASIAAFKKIVKDAVFQPVPLHRNKERERGFNQAMYIAKFMKGLLRYPICSYVYRSIETKPQAQMISKATRKSNVKGIFAAIPVGAKGCVGKTVIIVDDVVTTGSTVAELAKLLKKIGACKVYVVSLARG